MEKQTKTDIKRMLAEVDNISVNVDVLHDRVRFEWWSDIAEYTVSGWIAPASYRCFEAAAGLPARYHHTILVWRSVGPDFTAWFVRQCCGVMTRMVEGETTS